MRKTVQIAFGIALVILSIIASVWKTELINGIVYAVIIPSFVLSIISLVDDLSEKCKEEAQKFGALSMDALLQVKQELSNEHKSYMNSGCKTELGDALHEIQVQHLLQKEQNHSETQYVANEILSFCSVCQNVCEKICVVGYVLLFLSLSFSPYITKWLSAVDLNCISLWSLTFLYFSLEVKATVCDLIYKTLNKVYRRKFYSIENG